jgi:hypothetical protein
MVHPAPRLPARSVLYFVHAHRRAPRPRFCSPCKNHQDSRVADDPAERSFRGDPANVVRPQLKRLPVIATSLPYSRATRYRIPAELAVLAAHLRQVVRAFSGMPENFAPLCAFAFFGARKECCNASLDMHVWNRWPIFSEPSAPPKEKAPDPMARKRGSPQLPFLRLCMMLGICRRLSLGLLAYCAASERVASMSRSRIPAFFNSIANLK